MIRHRAAEFAQAATGDIILDKSKMPKIMQQSTSNLDWLGILNTRVRRKKIHPREIQIICQFLKARSDRETI